MRQPCAFTALKAQDAMCADMRCDTYRAAGAVKRPAFRTSLSGDKGRDETEDRCTLEPDKTRGDEACLNSAVMPAKAGRRIHV